MITRGSIVDEPTAYRVNDDARVDSAIAH